MSGHTTPEERHKVAERLREAAEDIEEVSPYPAIVLNEITNIIAINEITSYQDFFNRLADLIDPTCELDLDFGMEYIVCQCRADMSYHMVHILMRLSTVPTVAQEWW